MAKRIQPDGAAGQQLQAAFAKTVDALYIADGHHRCSTVDLYNEQLEAAGKPPIPQLAGLFSSDQVRVRAYHRVVTLGTRLSPLRLLAHLSSLCTIAPLAGPAVPEQPGELTLLLQDEYFRLRWRPEVLPEHGISLDAGLFNTLIAEPIFGITDVRTNERIHYVPGAWGIDAVLDLTRHRTERAGFLLHGIEPRDMFAVVDAGMIMPPKSTWFEPRLRNGLTVLEL